MNSKTLLELNEALKNFSNFKDRNLLDHFPDLAGEGMLFLCILAEMTEELKLIRRQISKEESKEPMEVPVSSSSLFTLTRQESLISKIFSQKKDKPTIPPTMIPLVSMLCDHEIKRDELIRKLVEFHGKSKRRAIYEIDCAVKMGKIKKVKHGVYVRSSR
jgi:hypothetical protein